MADLAQLIGGFRVTQALHVAATLGIADLLADGSRTSDELAAATETSADGLYRLLRALATVGVLDESPGRRFELTDLGSGLRSDAPGSLAAYAAYVGRPHHWNAWSELAYSVRSGRECVRAPARPEPVGVPRGASSRVGALRCVDDGAVATRRHDRRRLRLHALPARRRRRRRARLVPRGDPSFLSRLDRHPVRPGARRRYSARDRPLHGHRSGSFFEEVPRGGDAYVLKSVIHDWGDVEATVILRNCAAALEGDAVVLLVERDLAAPTAAWLDLKMLLMLGGRERAEQEYAALMAAAGLAYAGKTPVGAGFAVFAARAR